MTFGRQHPTRRPSEIGINSPNRTSSPSRDQGFTLIEILLAIALIGIIASVLAGDAAFFFRAAKKQEPPHRILRKAVLDATYLASQRKEIAYLRYDDEEESKDHGVLFIESATGSELMRYRIFELPESDDSSIDEADFSLAFEAEVPLSGVDGEEGDWNSDYWDDESVSLLRVAFHPSGASTPFLARLRIGFEDEEEKIYRFDPFSGYLRLKPDEK